VRNTSLISLYQKTRMELVVGLIFYWDGGLAWAPFVGIFIARHFTVPHYSMELILVCWIVPTVFTLFGWQYIGKCSANQNSSTQSRQWNAGTLAVKYPGGVIFILASNFLGQAYITLIAVLMIVVFFRHLMCSGAMVIDICVVHGNNNTPL